MLLRNFDVVNHPVRMRIYQALHGTRLSINQLAQLLPDVPKPSLYRHINRMLEAGVVEIADTRMVHGIEERIFTSTQGLIDPEAINTPEGLEKFADHVSLYGTFVAQDLAQYLLSKGDPDLDNVAAREYVFYATQEEFLQVREAIFELLARLEENPPAPGRIQRRMWLITHPLRAPLVLGASEPPSSET
ncbi:MAG: helix-turn-helix domain-containing protein [Caldilineales bacterium]|nr:helix-turn-helix domain-containing protein [Caldilineales bacterium]MDW8318125.1 helix-turn-helix domain-containing protein [Anaerolineae bacterium]